MTSFPWKAPTGALLAGIEVTAWTAWPILPVDGTDQSPDAWTFSEPMRPDYADWEPGSDSGGPNVFLDASDDQRLWLGRHLIPVDHDPLPAEIVALMRRDFDATFDVERMDSILLHLNNEQIRGEWSPVANMAKIMLDHLRERAGLLQEAVEGATAVHVRGEAAPEPVEAEPDVRGVYQQDVKMCGTAYVWADSAAQAAEIIAEAFTGTTDELPTGGALAFEVSGAMLNRDLPDVTLSPAVTLYGPWGDGLPSLAEAEADMEPEEGED